MTTQKNRSATIWIPQDLLDAIDRHGDEIRSRPGGKFSRNAWVCGVLRAAVAQTPTQTQPAAAGQTQTP